MNRTRWPALAMIAAAAVGQAFAAAPDAKRRDAQLADIDVVRTQYLSKEMAYAPATRTMAASLLDALARRAGALSDVEFEVGLAEVGALTDNAHSGLRLNDARVVPKRRLPLRMIWVADGLVVARAAGAAADLAGARVVKIEGRSPDALYHDAKVLLGGSDAGRKIWLEDWIEAAGVLHALGLAPSSGAIAMTFRFADGRTVERTIAMQPVSSFTPTAEGQRLWLPQPVEGEHGWSSALAADALPLYLRDAERPFRAVALRDLDAVYLQFRSNEDEKGFPIAAFLDDARKAIADTKPRRLVLDLRFDIGGNLLTTLDFMRALPASVDGEIALLVGPHTFSAGIISAAAVKKAGGDRVTIIGDEVGDRSHFWSEGANIELPHSHLTFRYTDGQFDLRYGCHGAPRCMDDLYPIIDVNGASLTPDIRAPIDVAAYLGKRDPAMDAVERRWKAADASTKTNASAPHR